MCGLLARGKETDTATAALKEAVHAGVLHLCLPDVLRCPYLRVFNEHHADRYLICDG
jgi:hypothetical protein